jgi:phosphate:Na+ symporter
MDFFSILSMLGGLSLFLYGMYLLGEGLSKVSGGRLEKILERLTANPYQGVLLGAGVTALIQSSSATTVMVVGFVNSGIMKLTQAVGIIMGANIGTTITSWILSLTGIESDNFFVRLLKPTSFSPLLALIGVCLILFAKKEVRKDAGTILIGFAVLMYGMDAMSAAVKPLAKVPAFTNILLMFQNPILGMLAGAALTAVIQSSSASVGILQALAATGSLRLSAIVPIVMGQNIGTCVTALLSAVGASKNAKRTALIHLYFNVIGTIVFMLLFYGVQIFVLFPFMERTASAFDIALVHTLFNLFATIVLLPFSNGLVRLANLTVPRTEEETEKVSKADRIVKIMDERFLDTPSIALVHCREVCSKMAHTVKKAVFLAFEQLDEYSDKKNKQLCDTEKQVKRYTDALRNYLTQLEVKHVSEKESHTISLLFYIIVEFERIGEYAVSLSEAAQKAVPDKGFSKKAKGELHELLDVTGKMMRTSVVMFDKKDSRLAEYAEPLENVIDRISREMKKSHIKRQEKGKSTIEMSFVLSDILTSLKGIANHCSNIIVCIHRNEEESHN